MFKLNGIVKVINPTVQVTEKFAKREFVITDNSSMYPQDILFQIMKDKVDILDAFGVGQQVEVSFNTKGRVWVSPQGEEKYFNTLECWKIESVGDATPSVAPLEMPTAQVQGDEDLPF